MVVPVGLMHLLEPLGVLLLKTGFLKGPKYSSELIGVPDLVNVLDIQELKRAFLVVSGALSAFAVQHVGLCGHPASSVVNG